MGDVFVIVFWLCLLLCGGLCLLLCGGCVCYCMGLCLLLCGCCVCYHVGIVIVIVWGLCLLLCGGCVCYCVGVVFVIVWGCVCYCLGVVFVIVIYVWLLKFNIIVWDDFGEVWGWSFVRCCLCQFEIGALDKGLFDLWVSHFFCLLFCCVSIVFEVH